MRLRCEDCGLEYAADRGEGDLRCPSCRDQGFTEESGTHVRATDAAFLLRVGANRAAAGAKRGLATLARLVVPGRHAPKVRTPGGRVEADPEAVCPGCGRLLGSGSSNVGGVGLCGRCSTRQFSRRPNVKRDFDPKKKREPLRAAERERPDKSKRTKAVLSRLRMNAMRRQAEGVVPTRRRWWT